MNMLSGSNLVKLDILAAIPIKKIVSVSILIKYMTHRAWQNHPFLLFKPDDLKIVQLSVHMLLKRVSRLCGCQTSITAPNIKSNWQDITKWLRTQPSMSLHQCNCLMTPMNNINWENWRLNGRGRAKAAELMAIGYTLPYSQWQVGLFYFLQESQTLLNWCNKEGREWMT